MKNFRRFMLMEGEPDATGGNPGILGQAFAKANADPPADPPADPLKEGDPPAAPSQDFTPNPIWSHLEQNYQITPPEGLSPENEVQELERVFGERAQANVQQPQLHPVVADLNQKFQDPEFKMEDWVTAQVGKQQMMQKTGKDFYADFLKLEYEGQVDDERVEKIIEGMSESELALKELEAKKVLTQREEAERTQLQQNADVQRNKLIEQETTRINQELTDLFGKTKNVKEIYGVELSEADVDAMNQTFKELVTPDPKTGEMGITRLLQSNEDLWKFAYLAISGDKKFKEALFNAKEGTKNSVFNQLKRTPSTSGRQPTTPVSGNSINPKRWTKPDLG